MLALALQLRGSLSEFAKELEDGRLSNRDRYERLVDFLQRQAPARILTDRERALARLAAALVFDDADAVRGAIAHALVSGVVREEVGLVSASVASLRVSSLLPVAGADPTKCC